MYIYDIMSGSRKTIVIVCDKSPHTSFGRLTLDLRDALSVEFDVYVIWLTTPKYFPNGLALPKDDSHITIHAPNLELGWFLFRKPLRRHLKKIKPNAVLLIRPELGFLVREIHKISQGTRAVVMAHDMFAETLYRTSLKFKLINKFFIDPTREADGFIYNSEYTKSEAHKVMGLDPNGSIVGCPIDRTIFKPSEKSKSSLKGKYKLDKYRGVYLNISLDEPRKNIATFFKLAKERPDIAFVRVGPFSKWMKKWIADNGIGNIIHYSGISQSELIELYNCADLFIYPSFLEGFGIPPLESLACGTPAVAADTSALKEVFAGVIPLVDPPDNVSEYLKIIDGVLANKDIVNWQAAEKLLERFSIENFGKRVRAAFGEMIS